MLVVNIDLKRGLIEMHIVIVRIVVSAHIISLISMIDLNLTSNFRFLALRLLAFLSTLLLFVYRIFKNFTPVFIED